MSRTRLAASVSFLCLTLAPALAPPSLAAGEGPWRLRAGAAWLESDAVLEATVFDFGFVSAETSGALGLGVSLEYRFSPRLGVELGVLTAEPDLDPDPIRVIIATFPPPPVPVFEPTSLRVTPLILGLDLHLSPDSVVDVYAGPLLAYVSYGDLRLTGSFRLLEGDLIVGPLTQSLGVADDFAFGAKLGADVRLGGRWSLAAAVTWIDTRLSVQRVPVPAASVDFDPLFFSLGAGYRF